MSGTPSPVHCARIRAAIFSMLLAASCLLVPARSAYAFKLETHVWIAQEVLNDLADDGRLTIPGFAGEFDVDPYVLQSLRLYPSQYRMGTIGPDGFPDMMAGQMTTHPGAPGDPSAMQTDDWLRFVLGRAPRYASPRTAFAYGYLTHAAGDVFAHSYVNSYAGDIFVVENQEVALRHIALEEYIKNHNPPLLDAEGHPGNYDSWLEVDPEFLRDTLIMNDTVANEYRRQPTTRYLARMYDFWKKQGEVIAAVDEAVAMGNGSIQGIRNTIHDLQQQIDNLTGARICINTCFVGCRKCFKIYPLSCFLEPSHCIFIESLKATLRVTDASLALPQELNRIAGESVKAPLVAWRSQVNEAMRQYILTSQEVAKEVLRGPEASPPGNPRGKISLWLCAYAPAFAAVPSVVTIPGCEANSFVKDTLDGMRSGIADFREKLSGKLGVLGWAVDPMQKVNELVENELKPQFADLLSEITGSLAGDNSILVSLINNRLKKHDANSLNVEFSEDSSGQGLLLIEDMARRADEDMHVVDDSPFDKNAFNAVKNAVTLAKLVLLPPSELNRMVRLAGIDRTIYGSHLYTSQSPFNVLFGAVRSIDGNQQWQEFALPYPRLDLPTGTGGQYGYGFDGARGFRLWQDCEVREKVFNRIFSGPIAPSLDSALSPGDPNHSIEGEPFPITEGAALRLKAILPASMTVQAETPRSLIAGLRGEACGGAPGAALTRSWSFANVCDFECTCKPGTDFFNRHSDCNCESLACGLTEFKSVQGWVKTHRYTKFTSGIGAPVDETGLEYQGSLICDAHATDTNMVMMPAATRIIALEVDDAVSAAHGGATLRLTAESSTAFVSHWREVEAAIQEENPAEGVCSVAPAFVPQAALPPDQEPPTIEAPDGLTVECSAAGAAGQAVDLGQPVVSDDRDAAVTVSNDAPDLFPSGTTTVTWTAEDAAGNAAVALQTVVIVDTAAPILPDSLPDVSVPATNPLGMSVTLTPPVAQDACDGPITASTSASLDDLAFGSHDVVWTAVDRGGNTVTSVQTIVITHLRGDEDVDGDVDRDDLNIVLEDLGQHAIGETSLRDFDGDGDVDEEDQTIFDLIRNGEGDPRDLDRDGTITIEDARILVTLCTVTCNVAPVAEPGPDRNLECAAPTGTPAILDATLSSDGDGDPLTFIWRGLPPGGTGIASGSAPAVVLPLGSTDITLTANDRFVDSAPASQTLTVADTTPPALGVPADLTLECAGVNAAGRAFVDVSNPLIAAWLDQARATDVCDATPRLTNDASAVLGAGLTTVAFTAADASGHTTRKESHIRVQYSFGGFETPLLPGGQAVIRQMKGGRTLPVKFSLNCGGATVSGATARLSVFKVLNAVTGSVDTTDLASDSGAANDRGDLFRFDGTHYIYNLSTRGFQAPATYRLVVTLDDGTQKQVDVSLR